MSAYERHVAQDRVAIGYQEEKIFHAVITPPFLAAATILTGAEAHELQRLSYYAELTRGRPSHASRRRRLFHGFCLMPLHVVTTAE